jgi:phosphoglucosamine mutase
MMSSASVFPASDSAQIIVQRVPLAQYAKTEKKLAGKGRVLLRPSGTEPVVRVMVEGEDAHMVDNLARDLAVVVENAVA